MLRSRSRSALRHRRLVRARPQRSAATEWPALRARRAARRSLGGTHAQRPRQGRQAMLSRPQARLRPTQSLAASHPIPVTH